MTIIKNMQGLAKKLKFFFICLVVGGLLNGCAYFKKYSQLDSINLTLSSDQDLNPNIFGRPSPLYVTVVQLQDAAIFNQIDALKLLNAPEASLGASLLLKKSIIVLPNTSQNVVIDLDKDATQLGIIAAFTKIKNSRWRLLIPITRKNRKVFLKFSQDSVVNEKETALMHNSKVIWYEGMLLTPQHFQQQEHYFEYLFKQTRAYGGMGQDFGLKKLTIDSAALALNRIVIEEMAGIFPDNTPFYMSQSSYNANIKQYLVIEPNAKAQKIYLCLPLQVSNRQQICLDNEHQYRYQTQAVNFADINAQAGQDASLVMGILNLCLRLEDDDLSNYTVIPIAKIKYCNEEEGIVLDDSFIPPVLVTQLAACISKEILYIAELIQERAKTIAERISNFDSQNKTHFNELLLLQTLNRHALVWRQATNYFEYPPRYFYNLALSLLGDLATFTVAQKYWSEPVSYQHDDLANTFMPILLTIRSLLNKVVDYSTLTLHLEKTAQGFWLSKVLASNLLENNTLIIAIKADMPQDELKNSFSNKAKLAGIEEIENLIYSHLPGLPLNLLSAVPAVLTYHAGFVYFEVIKELHLWKSLVSSGQVALHVPGDFPKFQMHCWLIKDK